MMRSIIFICCLLAHAEEAKEVQAPVKESHVIKAEKKKSPIQAKESNTLIDAAAIEDLKKTKADLAAEAQAIQDEKNVLLAKQKSIEEEMVRLEEARNKLTEAMEKKKQGDDEKIGKLVEILLSMSPKAAARVIENLKDKLAIAVMATMDTKVLSKIMNAMSPKKAADLSTKLAAQEEIEEEEEEEVVQKRPSLKNIPQEQGSMG